MMREQTPQEVRNESTYNQGDVLVSDRGETCIITAILYDCTNRRTYYRVNWKEFINPKQTPRIVLERVADGWVKLKTKEEKPYTL